MQSSHQSGRRRGTVSLSTVFGLLGLALVVVPLATGEFQGDPLDAAERANIGAFEGGATGTAADAGRNATLPVKKVNTSTSKRGRNSGTIAGIGGGDVPTGGLASPLFGAEPFTQKLVRFEEFGFEDMPTSFPDSGQSFPMPPDMQSSPDGAALDAFILGGMYPAPNRFSNTALENPWSPMIEQYLGRALDSAPAEGRPPGPLWAHQRWSEFYPSNIVYTAQAGARPNGGLRDGMQRHGYSLGEWGPGGLYHDASGAPGTSAGLEVRFHPNMPEQTQQALWTWDGTFPPKLMIARYGEPILLRHLNALPIDVSANAGFGLHTLSTHEHNGHTPAESDGYTNAFFFPGQYYDYRWPLALAGHDTVNTDATDPRAGAPDGNGGIINVPGDYRETMSTHWFHDHMLDFTAQNVYKGNAAMMNYYSSIDRGNEALEDGINLRFPSGTDMDWGNRDYDVNLLVADKAWDQSGQLWFNIFNLDGFIGDQMTVNWLYKPYLDVRARKYRFRILNGSVSRLFKIALVDQDNNRVPFHMIANDGNIMEHTIPFNGLNGTMKGILPTQGIAERYDIVVDFAQFNPGDRLYLVNLMEHDDGKGPKEFIGLETLLNGGYTPTVVDGIWTNGDPAVTKFMEFRVNAYDGVDLSMDPSEYEPGGKVMIERNFPSAAEIASATRRDFEFGRSSGTDDKPWTIKTDEGSGFGMDPRRVSAAPNRMGEDDENGTLEIWTLKNGTGGGWSHPVHIHFEEGMVLSRDGQQPPIWERYARKDLYRIGDEIDSSRDIEIALRFREFAGSYMEHCHNTQHEDHAMLLRWDIENPGQTIPMPAPLPTWDGVTFAASNALPTAGAGDAGPSDSLDITKAQYRASKDQWRIVGRTSDTAPGSFAIIYIGSDVTGQVLGRAAIKRNGSFKFQIRGSEHAPDSTNQISVVTTRGSQVLGEALQLIK